MKTNAILLALLISCMSLAGCVSQSDGVPEVTLTDEQIDTILDEHLDEFLENMTIVVNEDITNHNTYNSSGNLAPVISVDIGTPTFFDGIDCTTEGISIDVRHAMTDWSGSIIHAGWDLDLDGVIDYSVNTSEGYSTLEMPLSIFNPYNTTSNSLWGSTTTLTHENSIVFGAQDNDGDFTSSEIFLISVGGTLDTDPCRDFIDIADYNFTFSDHPDTVRNGGSDGMCCDYLANITRTNGQNGIPWDSVRMGFEGNSGGTGYSYGNQMRFEIIQTGNDDSMWEAGETITIKEIYDLHQNRGGIINSDDQEAEIWISIGFDEEECTNHQNGLCWQSTGRTKLVIF